MTRKGRGREYLTREIWSVGPTGGVTRERERVSGSKREKKQEVD